MYYGSMLNGKDKLDELMNVPAYHRTGVRGARGMLTP
jgi:hypothetical protein